MRAAQQALARQEVKGSMERAGGCLQQRLSAPRHAGRQPKGLDGNGARQGRQPAPQLALQGGRGAIVNGRISCRRSIGGSASQAVLPGPLPAAGATAAACRLDGDRLSAATGGTPAPCFIRAHLSTRRP